MVRHCGLSTAVTGKELLPRRWIHCCGDCWSTPGEELSAVYNYDRWRTCYLEGGEAGDLCVEMDDPLKVRHCVLSTIYTTTGEGPVTHLEGVEAGALCMETVNPFKVRHCSLSTAATGKELLPRRWRHCCGDCWATPGEALSTVYSYDSLSTCYPEGGEAGDLCVETDDPLKVGHRVLSISNTMTGEGPVIWKVERLVISQGETLWTIIYTMIGVEVGVADDLRVETANPLKRHYHLQLWEAKNRWRDWCGDCWSTPGKALSAVYSYDRWRICYSPGRWRGWWFLSGDRWFAPPAVPGETPSPSVPPASGSSPPEAVGQNGQTYQCIKYLVLYPLCLTCSL